MGQTSSGSQLATPSGAGSPGSPRPSSRVIMYSDFSFASAICSVMTNNELTMSLSRSNNPRRT